VIERKRIGGELPYGSKESSEEEGRKEKEEVTSRKKHKSPA
jgi:hypothetical protein